MEKLDSKLKSMEEKTTITDKLQKGGGFFELVKYCRIKLSRRFRRKVVGSLCAITMLATSLASAMTTTTYAEVIKRNATASTTAMAQNYLNKGSSSMVGLSYSKLLSNGSKYSLITDTTLLPILYSNWRATDVDSWYFYDSDGSVRTGWLYDNGWYYLSTEDEGIAGLMKYGWYQDNSGTWYFLNTIHDGTFGRAVSGWQWIDGYSYFFDENCRLVVSGSTTDGYTVDSDGRWTVDGVVQFVEGKGLSTDIVYLKDQSHSTTTKNSYSDDSVYSSYNRADDYSFEDDKSDIDDSQEDIVDDRNENQTATPSDASPSEATSSDATSSDASEYMPYGSTYTRAEWISLLVEKIDMALLEDDEELNHYYADTVDHEYASEIETAYAYNILPPADVEDLEQDVPLFYPDDIATREFVAYTAVRAMGFDGSHAYDISSWNDLDNLAYSNEAAIAIGYDFLSLDSSKNFNPHEPIYESDVDKIYDAIDEINDSIFISDEDIYDNTIYRENVLKDELLSLTEYEVSEEADGTYTVTMPRSDEAMLIAPESVIILPSNDVYYTGIALHVDSVQTIGDNMVLSARVPALEEVYVRIDFAQKGIVLVDQIEPEEGMTIEYESREHPDSASDYILASAVEIDEEWNIDFEKTWTLNLQNKKLSDDLFVTGAIKFSISDITCILDATFDWGNTRVDEFAIAIRDNISIEADLKHNGLESGLAQKQTYELRRFPIAIGTTGLSYAIVISIVVDIDGSIGVEYTLAGTHGFQYKDGTFRLIMETKNDLDVLDVRGEAKAGLKVSGILGLYGVWDLIGYAIEVGPAVNVSATANITDSSGIVCLDATAYLYLKSYMDKETIIGGMFIDSLLPLSVEVDYLKNDSRNPLKQKLHIENGRIVSECTLGVGTIEGYVRANESKEPIKNARIRIYIGDIADNILVRTVYTDRNGRYKIGNIEKGTYTIDISATGYQKYVVSDVIISAVNSTQYLETSLLIDRNEYGIGVVEGVITDAVTGRGISGVSYTVRKGWNKTSGDVLREGIFDEADYKLLLDPGNYTLQIKHDKYLTNHINIAISVETSGTYDIVLNPSGSGATTASEETIRIILTWGQTPDDLDSHLFGYKYLASSYTFHTYYAKKSFYINRILAIALDIDDTDAFGPETTTIYKPSDEEVYRFYVRDYTNRKEENSIALSLSGAKVQVYSGDKCIATYHVPQYVEGNVWHVFDYETQTHTIIPINKFTYVKDVAYWKGASS